MNGIRLSGVGSNIVIANQELIPASLQRLTAVAIHIQNAKTAPAQIIISADTQPTKPINTSVNGALIRATTAPNNPTNISNNTPIKYTPQYSLREALPSKAKYFLYFSILFITLTSLLVRYYQWWLTVYS
jgi:hypothetical protein